MVRVYYGDHFEHPSTHEHLTTPETVAKFANLFLSFLLMAGGIACAVMGIWLASTANEYNYFITVKGLTPSVLLITYGVGLFFFSSVACCATARHSGFLLGVIVVTMFLLIGAEVVGVTFAFTYRDNFKTDVKNESLALIAGYSAPGWEKNSTEVFDRIQQDLSCCGHETGPVDWSRDQKLATVWIRTNILNTPSSCCSNSSSSSTCGENAATNPANASLTFTRLECCGVSGGPSDWGTSGTNGTTLAVYWVVEGTHTDDAPDSCCKKNTTGCGIDQVPNKNETLWSKGCVTALFDWFDDKMLLFVGTVSTVLVFQIVNVCGMYLWRRCIVHGF